MWIRLSELSLLAYHGVFENERTRGTRFSLTIAVRVQPPGSDDLASTLDYTELERVVIESSLERQFNLLETWAQHVARRILDHFRQVDVARVAIRKPGWAATMEVEHVEVEVEMERGQ